MSDPQHREIIRVDDRLVRLIGIPFFGFVIPSATGLLDLSALTWGIAFIHYLYFTFCAWMIWEGNRWLLFRYYPIFLKSNSILQKYILMIGLNIFYTAPVSFGLLAGWGWVSGVPVSPIILFATVAVIVVCVIFVTNVYEKALFVQHTDQEQIRIEQLERAKIQAELTALKNQVDPHFMFNTLNSISYLTEHDPPKAQAFIEHLAEVYRYILRSKEKDLVLLRDEIQFMKSYASLMKLRYEEGFHLNLDLEPASGTHYLIPPVSMMVAVENAVKHNETSNRYQLVVNIQQKASEIVISNVMVARKQAHESNQTGLENLHDRFEKTLGKGIEISREGGVFSLRLPLLTLSA